MKAHLKQMVWPDPIIGYRRFVDGVCRAIFEDHAGQYICDEGRERIYGLYLIFEMDNPWTVVLFPNSKPGASAKACPALNNKPGHD